MSIALYTRRIWWDGDHGCAKAEGVYRSFSIYPKIRGIAPFDFLDFAPETGTGLITPHNAIERDITVAETAALNLYLDQMVVRAHSMR